jgi:hypothetical protein
MGNRVLQFKSVIKDNKPYRIGTELETIDIIYRISFEDLNKDELLELFKQNSLLASNCWNPNNYLEDIKEYMKLEQLKDGE